MNIVFSVFTKYLNKLIFNIFFNLSYVFFKIAYSDIFFFYLTLKRRPIFYEISN